MPTRVPLYEELITEFLIQYPIVAGPQYHFVIDANTTSSKGYQKAVAGYIHRFLEKMHDKYGLGIDDIQIGLTGLMEEFR